jgi:hypothetical protein
MVIAQQRDTSLRTKVQAPLSKKVREEAARYTLARRSSAAGSMKAANGPACHGGGHARTSGSLRGRGATRALLERMDRVREDVSIFSGVPPPERHCRRLPARLRSP